MTATPPVSASDAAGHLPVLVDEVAGLLEPQPGQTLVDCTLGRGGHAVALLPRVAGGTYLGLDTDAGNAAFSRDRLEPLAAAAGVRLIVEHVNFVQLPSVLAAHSIAAVDGMLADLGFASNQMDDPARGLAFGNDGPLDMRLDPAGPLTAADLVRDLPEKELADLIYQFGEERLSRRIARKIVETRTREPILNTAQLAQLVRWAYGPAAGKSRIHPATRTFMALRIAVNDELAALESLLRNLPDVLTPGGRAAIISFHSLEDRPVKQAFLKAQQDGWATRLTRKPMTASAAELAQNPRSRSAKLRGLRKV